MSYEQGKGAMSSVPSRQASVFCCSTDNDCFLAILCRSFRFIHSLGLLPDPSLTLGLIRLPLPR